MIAAVLLLLLQGGAIQRAVDACRAGQYLDAWESAQRAPSPSDRAQALTYVRYHAGDLDGALQAAEAGLALDVRDEYLNATACEIALALRASGSAARHLDTWARNHTGPDASRLEAARDELRRLEACEAAAVSSETRARWFVLAGGSVALLLFLGLLSVRPGAAGSCE